MATKLTRRGDAIGLTRRVTALVTRSPVPPERRANYVFAQETDARLSLEEVAGYRALIVSKERVNAAVANVPGISVVGVDNLSAIQDHYIVGIEPHTGFLRVLYRPESRHNTLFATDQCNSNCIMCSQPPKDIDDSEMVEEHLRLIRLVEQPPQVLGITGGEPTLLGKGLVRIIQSLKDRMPDTCVHMLTNGRRYADRNLVGKLAGIGHPAFTSAVPLYADIAGVHNYVVQAAGAFDETM